MGDRGRQVTGALIFAPVIAANALAGSGALSGESIGVIANRYPSWFLPASYVFSIWSLIYLMLLAFTVYQALPGSRESAVLRRIGGWWVANGILNIAWVSTFSFALFAPSLLIMAALLGTLVVIQRRIGPPAELTGMERLCIWLPFGLYLSWISIAVIANTFQFVNYMGWDGLGLDTPAGSAVMMVGATALGTYLAWRRGLWVFPLVAAWAIAGIAARFPEVPLISRTAWTTVILGLTLLPAGLLWTRIPDPVEDPSEPASTTPSNPGTPT